MNRILKAIATIGAVVAGLGSAACLLVIADEPAMPQSMIK